MDPCNRGQYLMIICMIGGFVGWYVRTNGVLFGLVIFAALMGFSIVCLCILLHFSFAEVMTFVGYERADRWLTRVISVSS